MPEDMEKAPETSAAPAEEQSPLAEVHELVTKAEGAITDGSKTKDEVIDELVTELQGMKGEEKSPMGGLGNSEPMELEDEEAPMA